MRHSFLFAVAAVSAATLALPAAAQVAGGVTGNVGGQIGLSRPDATPLTGQVGQTIRDAGGMTRDTVQGAASAAGEIRPQADVRTSIDAEAQAESDGAQAELDVSTGTMVHASDGAMLGTVQSITRDTAGRVQGFVVRTADGVVRSVPATGTRIEGDAVVTGWSRAQFDQAPAN